MPKFISRLFNGISKKKTESSLNHDHRIKRLEKIIGSKIEYPNIFLEALTHRSTAYSKISNHKFHSNERLEFLGDSILNLVIGEYIFGKFKKEEEGFMTKIRARFVNREILALTGERLKLDEILFMSENAKIALRNGAKSMISDALEAVIGAIYLDKGIEQAKKFIHKYIIRPNKGLLIISEDKNYKSRLLEFTQAQKLTVPNYQVMSEEGPHHSKTFTIQVFIGNLSYGEGKGPTKKTAEQIAALKALEKLRLV
ncbi:MAG: ribonuclease III [Bacteroidetes bacterium]|nr:ribonuclease III [Bacteroidota bacterium]MBU2585170.1 ribonuclease III [Bacteroidota bacterium]